MFDSGWFFVSLKSSVFLRAQPPPYPTGPPSLPRHHHTPHLPPRADSPDTQNCGGRLTTHLFCFSSSHLISRIPPALLLFGSFQSLPHIIISSSFVLCLLVLCCCHCSCCSSAQSITLLLPSLGCAALPSLPILLEIRVGGNGDSQALLLELHAKFLGSRLGHNGNGGKVVGVRGQRAFPSFGAG